ncbi:guanine nucleotide exchange factor, putative [Entamoeba invadens IP1]|uniref:Guanine nucleotide exchange factor, putative n=1 Tax=Entamoeba invadens IP1 TaxID=370355 RepID=A0A0A1U3I7_ENTIV|nr:guanine nucleotide exchange factor, putative [Entamoeba invadens IP1]ELP86146.1 guanine nucleotide exchange factor, putative [Entamoeba invadens IP1]|eukprot:XP_004185492.1 guanine nucleotide exchange factor, putative [Entamoeba invadens IP1]
MSSQKLRKTKLDQTQIANQATPQLGQSTLGAAIDFDAQSVHSSEDQSIPDVATIVITETVNESTAPTAPPKRRVGVPVTRNSLITPPNENFQTKYYGECPFFPKHPPENITQVYVTSGNVFLICEDAVYATGLVNFKEKKTTDVPFIAKCIPVGVRQITGNHKKVLILIEGKVYTCSNLEDQNCLKRVGELLGVTQIACSEDHYAALTTLGDVYLWGANTYGEIGKDRVVSMERPTRVKELDGKKVIKVVCSNGYTACLTDTGDIISLGEMTWKNPTKVVDVIALRTNLWGLTVDGRVISDEGNYISGDYTVGRITEGLGSLVGDSKGLLLSVKNNEWQLVENIGSRDWSGCATALVVLAGGKKIGFELIYKLYKNFITQMEVIKRVYVDVLLPTIKEKQSELEIKEKKEEKKKKKRTVSYVGDEMSSHFIKLLSPLESFEDLYNVTLEMYGYLMMLYSNNSCFKIWEFYERFFRKVEKEMITYADAFPKLFEVLNIIRVVKSPLLKEISDMESKITEDESTDLFNKHTDLLTVSIIPFKFMARLYDLSVQYRKVNKDFSRSYFERFETVLSRCNESLKFEDILSIEHVYSTPSNEFIVYLSPMRDLVLQLTRPNVREPKYREIFLLMFRLYTSPEVVMTHLIPHASIEETLDRKAQILIVLKQWMQSYPSDFSALGLAEQRLLSFLKSSREPFTKIKQEKAVVLELFHQIKGKPNFVVYQPLSFESTELCYTDFLGDVNKISNSMTYVYKKLFIRIKQVELLYYLDKNKKDQTGNIKNMVDSFNGLSKMYMTMFNNTPQEKKLNLLENTIKMLDVFLKRDRNYHAICGIVFSFVRINDIETLKKKLPSDAKKRYEFFDNLCLFESNYKNLREKIANSEQPLLPFMGTISRDLVLASEYNASKEKELYNLNKLRIMHGVVVDIINYQPGEPTVPSEIDQNFHQKFCQMHGI